MNWSQIFSDVTCALWVLQNFNVSNIFPQKSSFLITIPPSPSVASGSIHSTETCWKLMPTETSSFVYMDLSFWSRKQIFILKLCVIVSSSILFQFQNLWVVPEQVSAARRVSGLCAQHTVQSPGNIHVCMPRRFLHKCARVHSREDWSEERRAFHVVPIDLPGCSQRCRLGAHPWNFEVEDHGEHRLLCEEGSTFAARAG